MNDIRLVESAISELEDLNRDSRLNLSMRDQIQHLQSGLLFLQLYAQCLAKWNDALQGKKNRDLGSARKSHIKATLAGATKGLYSTGVNALATQDFQQWNDLASDLLRRIQHSKPKIKEDSLYLLNSSFQCRFSSSDLQMFFRNLSNSLDEIVRLKSRNMVDVLGIKEKLDFFAKIFELARKMRSSNKDFKDFSIRIQSWAYYTACLLLLYRVHDENCEEILPRMRILLSASEVTRMFLAVLRHLWSLSHNRLLMDEGVPKFVDFLLETFHNVPMKDGIRRNLRSNLIFLTTFLVDPPTTEEYREDAGSIARDVHDIICPTNAIEIQGGTDEDFQGKFEAAKGKVSELYALIFADSTSFDFPKINVSGFLDSLINNMREISDSMPDHDIDYKMLGEDLLSLGSFLNDISRKNIDLWRQIVNVVYRVEIAVNMSSYLNDCVWYDKKFLSNIREEINLVKSDVEKLKNDQFHDIKVPNVEISSVSVLSIAYIKPITDEDIVGFKDDFRIIVDKLLNRTEGLMMVSIVGMAGQGKTTLANMVSCHPSVYSHFHKRMWCVVSPTFQRKRLLLDILNTLGTYLDSSNMEEEALEELLRKSLKQRRYLIVMDDVWDAKAWDDLKLSFPDDGTGSRILLTTRNLNVVHGISASMPTSIHELNSLSHSESLDLLRRRLFCMSGDFPDPDFAAVGKQIAGNCNGLPRAIIVIADLLKEKVDCFDWWKQMAESLDSQIASRGGIDSVELSYKHLPEHLKPCFLYFGAFQADKVIRARRLIQLWVSEGLVRKTDGKSLVDVAKGCLKELVSRSLVVVTDTSSTGGIKTCRIDSLFFEFCLAKIKEEKFLQVESGDDLSFKSKGTIYKNYRICIQSGGDGFFASNPLGPCVHSLLLVPDYTCLNKGELFSICNFMLLHILDLEDMEFNGYFPEEVTLLILLRYLAIWCPSGIFSIPATIGNLRKLETFRVKREVRSQEEIGLPDTLWEMKRLRHIDVDGFTVSFSSETDEEECLALDNIQTFSAPSLCYGKDAEKLLKRLPNVRKLRCQFNDSSEPYHENGFPELGVLRELESLNVRYVGSLSYPSLAFSIPSTLKKLTLSKFKLPWSEMSTVGELPNLESLKLLEDAFEGKEWVVIMGNFSKLRFLKLSEMNITHWKASHNAFPSLEQLIVENCYQLEKIPLEFGGIYSLVKIQVRWCKLTVASSASEIKEEQYDLGNEHFETHIRDILKPT